MKCRKIKALLCIKSIRNNNGESKKVSHILFYHAFFYMLLGLGFTCPGPSLILPMPFNRRSRTDLGCLPCSLHPAHLTVRVAIWIANTALETAALPSSTQPTIHPCELSLPWLSKQDCQLREEWNTHACTVSLPPFSSNPRSGLWLILLKKELGKEGRDIPLSSYVYYIWTGRRRKEGRKEGSRGSKRCYLLPSPSSSSCAHYALLCVYSQQFATFPLAATYCSPLLPPPPSSVSALCKKGDLDLESTKGEEREREARESLVKF